MLGGGFNGVTGSLRENVDINDVPSGISVLMNYDAEHQNCFNGISGGIGSGILLTFNIPVQLAGGYMALQILSAYTKLNGNVSYDYWIRRRWSTSSNTWADWHKMTTE